MFEGLKFFERMALPGALLAARYLYDREVKREVQIQVKLAFFSFWRIYSRISSFDTSYFGSSCARLISDKNLSDNNIITIFLVLNLCYEYFNAASILSR